MPEPIQTIPAPWTLAQAPAPTGTDPSQDVMLGRPAEGIAATPGTTAPGTAAPARPTGSGMNSLLPMIAIFAVMMIVMTTMTNRREKKKRADLMSSLKRHDKVLTIGGILATVAEVRDDEVVLRIDDNTNTKMRVTRSAIQQIIQPSTESAPAGGTPAVEVKGGKGERAAV